MQLKPLLFLLLFTTFLFSQNLVISTESIEKFFDNNFSKKACNISAKRIKKDPANFKANLHYGQCSLNRGDIDAAMAAFDRADILEEESFLVHKCVGDMHAKIGNYELASTAYDTADRLCPTPVERITVENKKPHTFSVQLYLSGGFDDNIKLLGSISNVNNWFGIVSDPSSSSSDWFTNEYLHIEHKYKRTMSSPYYYKSKIEILNKNYNTTYEDDMTFEFVETGPAWKNDHFDIWLPLGYTKSRMNYKPYSESIFFKPQFLKPLENEFFLMAELNVALTRFLQWELGDFHSYSSALLMQKQFDKQMIKVGYRYLLASNVTPASTLLFINHQYNQFNVAYSWTLCKDLSVHFDLVYRISSYEDAVSVGSMDKRFDILKQYRASFNYTLTDSLSLMTQYIRYNNETNYMAHNYTQNIISLGINSFF